MQECGLQYELTAITCLYTCTCLSNKGHLLYKIDQALCPDLHFGCVLLLQVCVWCMVDSRLLHLVLLQRHQQRVLLLAVLLQLVEAAALLHDLRAQPVAGTHPWSTREVGSTGMHQGVLHKGTAESPWHRNPA